MKSIKEKALDIYPKMSRISEPYGNIPACNESCYLGDANEEKREGFEAGANYVLDAIEEFLNFYGVCCITSSAKTYLKEMIEQLKK